MHKIQWHFVFGKYRKKKVKHKQCSLRARLFSKIQVALVVIVEFNYLQRANVLPITFLSTLHLFPSIRVWFVFSSFIWLILYLFRTYLGRTEQKNHWKILNEQREKKNKTNFKWYTNSERNQSKCELKRVKKVIERKNKFISILTVSKWTNDIDRKSKSHRKIEESRKRQRHFNEETAECRNYKLAARHTDHRQPNFERKVCVCACVRAYVCAQIMSVHFF